MTYHDYQAQTEIYNDLIDSRIQAWASIAQNELGMWEHSDTSYHLKNTDARSFITENVNLGIINYTYPITVNFDIYYSGCSNEEGDLDLPIEILWEDENDWQKYLTLMEESIKENNESIEKLIQYNKDQEKLKKKINISDRERTEYIRLREKFEGKT